MTEVNEANRGTGLEIAVIGMAGRFPGGGNINEFWENLKNGLESISFFSDEELESEGIDTNLVNNPNFVKASGTLAGKEYFDASFFGYTPIEAEIMDPQMRIFHECCWQALEDAGYDPGSYGKLIGLYAGAASDFGWDALCLLTGKVSELGQFAASLLRRDFLCTKTSYNLGLKGPAVFVQTACSTSLVAIHLACQGLLAGECDMALGGGVAIFSQRKGGYIYQEGMIASCDGHCRAFDAAADGTVPGEGIGMVVLKRLGEAIAAKDHIYAVVKGSAINNDGDRKVGFTAPSVKGQAEVIQTALQVAEVEPGSIRYIEAHGTGTTLGDPVEVKALKKVFKTNKKNICGIGSVKTNMGHLDSAAGVTGFIKTVLALKHRHIPPSLHFDTPNPEIDFENSPFYVNTTLKGWKNHEYPLRAGVSSFGIGGTNAHVILEEAPAVGRQPTGDSREYQLLLLSAKTPSALDKMTQNLADYFRKNLAGLVVQSLSDAAYTLQVGRRAFRYRRMLVCSDVNEAVETLSSPGSTKLKTVQIKKEERPVIFMFSGLGSQYVDMGLELYRTEAAFKEEMDRCFEILNTLTDDDIKKILYPGEAIKAQRHEGPGINRIEIAQVVIFILEYALAKLLMKWGIKPAAMIGYSFGEYTAACLSGVLSLEDALKLIVGRGQLISRITTGSMLSVPLTAEEVKPLLIPGLSIAINNGPSCITAGPGDIIDAFEKQLKRKRLLCIRVPNSHAIHSQMMEPILKEYENLVREVKLNKPQIPYISDVTGHWMTGKDAVDPVYWCRHLRETVRFADGVKELMKTENSIFLEIGPGRDLSTLLVRHIEGKPGLETLHVIRHSGQKIPDNRFLLNKLGRLWLWGVNIDWTEFHAGEKRFRTPLPTYPFERQRYWIDGDPMEMGARVLGKNAVTRKKPDIADWFYMPSWKRIFLSGDKSGDISDRFCWLLFIDNGGPGSQLAKKLREKGQQVITVEKGTGFQKENDFTFIINPQKGHDSDYDALFDEINRCELVPDRIVHLWNITAAPDGLKELEIERVVKAQDVGFYSLINIAQSLGRKGADKAIEITVVTDSMQEVSGGDGLYPEKTTVLGPVRVIPEEYPNIRCRSIDVETPGTGSAQQENLVDRLLAELTAELFDPIVAFRGNHRWLPIYEPVRLEKPGGKNPRLRQQGVYLVIGGLGGIGFLLARYLAETVRAKLILTGRSGLPSNNEGEKEDVVSRKIGKVMELEKEGSEVLVINADITDEKEMQTVIDRTLEKFGRINGVIHAAGLPDGELIQRRTRKTSERILAAKLNGTLVLDKILKDIQLDFFIICSSTNGILPAVGQVSYCAANTFLDAFAIYKNSKGVFTVSVNWDRWENTGIAVIAEELHKRLTGEDMTEGMTAREGVEAFHRILAHLFPQIIVSTLDFGMVIERSKDSKSSSFIEDVEEIAVPGDVFQRPELDTPYVGPRNETEEILANTWSICLGFEPVGIYDDFFELGADSLKALMVISKIHKELNVEVPIAKFFSKPTIETLAAYIENAKKSEYYSIEPAEEKEYYALSPAQERIYITQQMNVKGIGYNEHLVLLLEGDLHREKIADALKHLVTRHDVLRTSIVMINNDPVQWVHESGTAAFAPEYYEADENEAEGILKAFIRPFDLLKPPFLRVGLIRIAENAHILIVDMHHIFADAVSQELLVNDFLALYSGEELPPLKLQYKDFSEWQHQLFRSGKIQRQEEYWLNRFKHNIPVLNLPTDYPGSPTQQSDEGKTIHFTAKEELTAKLFELAKQTDTTIYMVLSAVCVILLSRYTGQEDIVVGTPISSRRHNDLQNIMGMFVNLLAMRNQPKGDKTLRKFLAEVKENALNAYENQDYQFEELVRKLALKGNTLRNPLVKVVFAEQQAIETTTREIPGLTLKPYSYERETSKFDLRFGASVINNTIAVSLTYSTALFKEETALRLTERYLEILEQVLEDFDINLKDIKISHHLIQTEPVTLREYREDFEF